MILLYLILWIILITGSYSVLKELVKFFNGLLDYYLEWSENEEGKAHWVRAEKKEK